MIRPETEQLYQWATHKEEYELQLLIALYIRDGWDEYWPYTDRPQWLQEQYHYETLDTKTHRTLARHVDSLV